MDTETRQYLDGVVAEVLSAMNAGFRRMEERFNALEALFDSGRPVGRLAPLEGEAAVEGPAAELVRAGLARGPIRGLGPSTLAADRPQDPEGRSLEAVSEERAEGW